MTSATAKPTPTAKPLSFMEKLGPLVSFHGPSEAPSTSADHQPQLIIVAGWTDARDAHMAKYIVKYQALYPAAQILLLRSTMSCILRPAQIGPAMKPAASVVRAASQSLESSSSPALLIHVFSNGGSSSVANLYEQYAAMAGPDGEKRLPPHVTIFDSCPGRFGISQSVAFISSSLSSLQQLTAAPFLYAFAVFWTVTMALGIFPNSLGEWYKSHNNHFGNLREERRVYIYSSNDALTAYKDVELHAAEAKDKGFSVALEKYVNSAHVAHLRMDETRYWNTVKKIVAG